MGIGFRVILYEITPKEGNTEIIYLHVGGSLLASPSFFLLKPSHLVIDDQVDAI